MVVDMVEIARRLSTMSLWMSFDFGRLCALLCSTAVTVLIYIVTDFDLVDHAARLYLQLRLENLCYFLSFGCVLTFA